MSYELQEFVSVLVQMKNTNFKRGDLVQRITIIEIVQYT
ncbi:hypothetical protein JL09_g5197 [Pichia kudriavzevii]|uniref:Uncharacterized protein n=1 Tax=Pichia kudriavzevii TaxID=4909 RepID=A0A099NS59_PICKU|nr:hypothetical protein JL09_g5197 [Pichia kudriavzevii]